MYLCVRVDLDYVPWDTPDAQDFGHAEPAMVLRLLELSKATGAKLHFFASNRVLRAFPATTDAVLNEGHDLDWFCKHPESLSERFAIAREEFGLLGNTVQGFAVRGPWPDLDPAPLIPREFKFISSGSGKAPSEVQHFPVETRPDRDALRSGQSMRAWLDGIKAQLRQTASIRRGATIVLRPQVLGKADPKLASIRELLEFAMAIELKVRTLRDLVNESPAPGGA